MLPVPGRLRSRRRSSDGPDPHHARGQPHPSAGASRLPHRDGAGRELRRGRLRACARRRGRRRRAAPGRGGHRRDRRRRDGQGELDHVSLRARERPRAAAGAARGRGHAAPEPRPPGVPGVLRAARRGVRPHDGEHAPGGRARPGGDVGRRDGGRGQVLVLHGADRVRRRPAPARHRAPEGCSRRGRRRRRLPPGGRAREHVLAPQRVLRDRGGVRLRARRRAARGVQGHRRRRLPRPGRRRGAAPRVRLDPLARRLGGGLPPLGRAARRRARPRALGDPAGPDPLPRLPRELARPARLRPAARAR